MSVTVGFALYSEGAVQAVEEDPHEIVWEGRSPRKDVLIEMADENVEVYGGRWTVVNLANQDFVYQVGTPAP